MLLKILSSVLIALCFFCPSFSQEVVQKNVLIMVTADWCGYCGKAKNDINNDAALSEKVKDYDIVFIDYDVDKDFVRGYNIKTLPTFIILDVNNKEVKRKVGYKGANNLVLFLQ